MPKVYLKKLCTDKRISKSTLTRRDLARRKGHKWGTRHVAESALSASRHNDEICYHRINRSGKSNTIRYSHDNPITTTTKPK